MKGELGKETGGLKVTFVCASTVALASGGIYSLWIEMEMTQWGWGSGVAYLPWIVISDCFEKRQADGGHWKYLRALQMLCLSGQAMKQRKKSRAACLLILAGLLRAAEAVPVKANVSLFYFNTLNNSTEADRCECGLYGVHSPAADAQGLVVIPNSTNLQACTWDTEFVASRSPWIALIERGNCTFTEKINRAARQGAEAVVIYNYPSRGNYTVPMAHPGKCYEDWFWKALASMAQAFHLDCN